jgi:hypothetical protein
VALRPNDRLFTEPTLAATEPLEGENTREDLRADIMVRAAIEAERAARAQAAQVAPQAPHAHAFEPTAPAAGIAWDQPAATPETFTREPVRPSPPVREPIAPAPSLFARDSASHGQASRDSARHAAAREQPPLEEVRPSRARKMAPLVLAASAGLLIAFLAWMRVNRPTQAPVAVTSLVTAPAQPPRPVPTAEPMPPPVPAARPAPSERPSPPEPAAEAPEPALAKGPRNCRARIESTPKGAVVMLGRVPLGRTPLVRTAVPCGAASVTLTHPRYLPATVSLEAAPNAPVSVTARLSRPAAQLQLSSSPAGAVFKVNGNRVGRGPRNVTVSRFETVRVEARLPGQKPWRRNIYLKDPVTDVQAAFE